MGDNDTVPVGVVVVKVCWLPVISDKELLALGANVNEIVVVAGMDDRDLLAPWDPAEEDTWFGGFGGTVIVDLLVSTAPVGEVS